MKYGNKISISGYVFVFLNFIFLTYLLIFNKGYLNKIATEDSYIEYLGFIFLLLTSIFLFLISLKYFKSEKDKKILAIMFLIAGFLFFWAAGEEISWGQRILNLKTPDILIPLNDQNEINIHNINKKFFQRAFQHSITLVILLSTIAFFLRRTHFFKIKIPDVFLTYSFLFIPVYNRFKSVSFEYLIGEAVFLFFLFYFLKKQNIKMLIITILSICFNIAIVLVHYNFDNNFNANDTPEVREYIFSFLCFIYSLYLFNDSLQNKYSAGYLKKASIEN